MKLLTVVLLCCCVVSCGNSKLTPHFIGPKPPEPTGDQKIAYLKGEAAKRNLHWRVFCVWWVEDQHFEGVAWRDNATSIDHTSDRWMEDGKTQADAAYQLYRSIQGAPTHPAEKGATTDLRERPADCPPDITWQN